MAIDPQNTDAVAITQLDDLVLALESFLVGANADGKMGKFTAEQLADFISPFVASLGGSGYVPVSGTALPTPATPTAFTFVGPQTSTQAPNPSIITTEPLNLLGYNGTLWSLMFAIPIDLSSYVAKTDLKNIERDIQPIMTSGSNVVKNGFSIVLTGSTGFYHGTNSYALVAAGTYALGTAQCLVVSNVDKTLKYDGGVGNQPILTPTIKTYTSVGYNDIVLAWRDAADYVQTIWDLKGIPDLKVTNRDIQPIILFGGSITKSGFSYIITGSIGFFQGDKQYALVAPGTYALSTVQCLVVSNVNKRLRYDGSGGNQPVLTPTVKLYTAVTESDVVVAWRDGADNMQSIWGNIGAPDFTVLTRGIQPLVFNGGTVSKSNLSYTFNSCGFYMGNKQYVILADGTYTMNNIIECLVVSNINKNLRYDGTGGNQPKPIPVVKTYVNITESDIVIAWRGTNSDTYSIFDTVLQSVRITTPFIDKYRMADIFTKVYNQDNIRALFTGDSIFMSSNWWANGLFPFGTTPYSTKVGTDNSQPLQFTDNILSRKLYDLLLKHSINIPVYRRFDYGSTFDYDSGSGTFGQDTTPGSKFFTETGAFGTFVGSSGNGVNSSEYGTYGAAAQIPMTLADATTAFTGASWYNSQSQEGFTRISYGASSTVQFTIPAGFSKFRIKLRKNLDGDTITTALTNCTGAASINLDYGAVTHVNNSYFIDVEFTVTNTANPAIVTLTKSANTAKNIAYWGVIYFNEPCTIINNGAYGGQTTANNFNALPDLLAADTYDFIVWELQLLNDYLSSTYAASKTAITNYINALIAHGKPVIAVIPQRGSFEGVLAADKMWGMAKGLLLANDIPFIDLGVIESSVVRQLGRASALNYLYSTFGGVHPVGRGIDTLAVLFEGLIND